MLEGFATVNGKKKQKMGFEYELKQDDLAACPFCGSIDQETNSKGMVSISIMCKDCGAEGPPMPTEDEAVTAWFTRATMPLSATVEAEGFTVMKTMLEVFDIMANPAQFRSALAAAVAKRTPSNA